MAKIELITDVPLHPGKILEKISQWGYIWKFYRKKLEMPRISVIAKFKRNNQISLEHWILHFLAQLTALGIEKKQVNIH